MKISFILVHVMFWSLGLGGAMCIIGVDMAHWTPIMSAADLGDKISLIGINMIAAGYCPFVILQGFKIGREM